MLFDFIHRLKADPNQLIIKGDGAQSKLYVHVQDVLRWLAWDSTGDSFNFLNVATDDATTGE